MNVLTFMADANGNQVVSYIFESAEQCLSHIPYLQAQATELGLGILQCLPVAGG